MTGDAIKERHEELRSGGKKHDKRNYEQGERQRQEKDGE